MDIKTHYTKIFLKAANIEPTTEELKKYRVSWWWNVRVEEEGGLRLTDAGLEFVQTVANIKTFEIGFPKSFEVTPQVLVWLDNFIESPYFINKKFITVLTERTALELHLYSGDVRRLGHSKALSKRLGQNQNQ